MASESSIPETAPQQTLPRKAATYGGSRAWSAEEESFLLESRQRKTPYKHIALHLHKTELACRLHYHQLAYGTKRKRRGTSTSSAAGSLAGSTSSLTSTAKTHTPRKSIDSDASHLSPQPPLIALASVSPPVSPDSRHTARLARSESPLSEHPRLAPGGHILPATTLIPSSEQFPPFQHLPRIVDLPSPMPDRRRTSSCSLEPPGSSGTSYGISCAATAPVTLPALHPSRDYAFTGSRNTNVVPTFLGASESTHIDPVRLGHCYRAHRYAFWNTVARDYGGGIDGLALEAAFLRQHAISPVNSLPTPPSRSPVMVPVVLTEDFESGKVTVKSTASIGRPDGKRKASGSSTYSIASILTEDQDVYSHRA